MHNAITTAAEEKKQDILALDLDSTLISNSVEARGRIAFLSGSKMREIARLLRHTNTKIVILTAKYSNPILVREIINQFADIGIRLDENDLYFVFNNKDYEKLSISPNNKQLLESLSSRKAEVIQKLSAQYEKVFVVDDDMGFLKPIHELDKSNVYTFHADAQLCHFNFIIAYLLTQAWSRDANGKRESVAKDEKIHSKSNSLSDLGEILQKVKSYLQSFRGSAASAEGILKILALYQKYEFLLTTDSQAFYKLGLLLCIADVANERLNIWQASWFKCCYGRDVRVQDFYDKIKCDVSHIDKQSCSQLIKNWRDFLSSEKIRETIPLVQRANFSKV